MLLWLYHTVILHLAASWSLIFSAQYLLLSHFTSVLSMQSLLLYEHYSNEQIDCDLKFLLPLHLLQCFLNWLLKVRHIRAKWDMGFREEKVEIISLQIVFLSYITFTKMKIIPLIFRLLARVVQIFIYVPLHCLVINASNQFCFFKCLGQLKHLESTQTLGQNFLRYLDFLPEDTSLYKPWV